MAKEPEKGPIEASATLAGGAGGSSLRSGTRHYNQGRLLQERGGRSPDLDDQTVLLLRDELESWLNDRVGSAGMPHHAKVLREDAIRFIEGKLESLGLKSSPLMIARLIVRPTFRRLRSN
jgi:hypothetical protein